MIIFLMKAVFIAILLGVSVLCVGAVDCPIDQQTLLVSGILRS